MATFFTLLTIGVGSVSAISLALLGGFTAYRKNEWRWFFSGMLAALLFTVPTVWMVLVQQTELSDAFALFFTFWAMVLVVATSVFVTLVWERRNNNDPVFFTAVVSSTAAIAYMFYALWLYIDHPLWRYASVMSTVGSLGMVFLLVSALFLQPKKK